MYIGVCTYILDGDMDDAVKVAKVKKGIKGIIKLQVE